MNELWFGSVPQTPLSPRVAGRLSSPPVSRPLAVKLGGQTDIRRRACPRPQGGGGTAVGGREKEVDGGGWVYADQARPRGECATHVCRRNSTSRRRLTKAECSGSIIVIMSFLFHEVRAPGPLTIRRVIDRTCMILPGTRRNIYRWNKCVCTVSIARVLHRARIFLKEFFFSIDIQLVRAFVRIYIRNYKYLKLAFKSQFHYNFIVTFRENESNVPFYPLSSLSSLIL